MPEQTTPPRPPRRDFLAPDLGEGLEELTIVEWLVAPGDPVTLNQPLCVVETAKAEVEIPSPRTGTIGGLGGDPGDTIAVGALLVRFDDDLDPAGDGRAPGRPQPTLVGYGHDAAIDHSRRAGDRASRREAARPGTGGRAADAGPRSRSRARPAVRKLARDLGVDLATVTGSGPGEVITPDDVQAAAGRRSAPAAPTPSGGATHAVPVTGIRARVAERTATSRRRIPDATCGVVVDCTRLLDVRAALDRAAVARGLDVVVTPFSLICHLAVRALRTAPTLNATFVEDVPEIRVHDGVDLGIGTATERGLVVTVARDAHRRSTLDLSCELARLTVGARSGTLGPADMHGSTFTVSNFGALGLDEGIPVINHPEAAILGIGSIRPRPHVVDDRIAIRRTASFTLAFDHRVCDGAEAGRFLGELRALVEAPEALALDTDLAPASRAALVRPAVSRRLSPS